MADLRHHHRQGRRLFLTRRSLAEETDDKAELKSALGWGCTFVIVVNVGLAVFGYFLWGDDVNGYIFCNGKSSILTYLN